METSKKQQNLQQQSSKHQQRTVYVERSKQISTMTSSSHQPASPQQIHAPRPIRPVPMYALHKTAHSINIPSDVLSQAEHVESLPNLKPDQHFAQVEVELRNGTLQQVFVVVQEQQSATQPSSSHPGDASYYDDCVSDYSHEQSRASSPAPRRLSPSEAQKRMNAEPARSTRISPTDAARLRNVTATPMSGVFGSDLSRVMSKRGMWYKVLRSFVLKPTGKLEELSAQAKEKYYVSPFVDERNIVACLVSFGREIVELYSDGVPAKPASSVQRELPTIQVIPTDQEIHHTIPTMPREELLAFDLKRRAAQQNLPRFPEQKPVVRKPLRSTTASGDGRQGESPSSKKAKKAAKKAARQSPPMSAAYDFYSQRDSLANP